jgi:hypothetical protein
MVAYMLNIIIIVIIIMKKCFVCLNSTIKNTARVNLCYIIAAPVLSFSVVPSN